MKKNSYIYIMKEHKIKIKVDEVDLNDILDAKMDNQKMSKALTSYANRDLNQFLHDNGFGYCVKLIGDILLKEIENKWEEKKKKKPESFEEVFQFEQILMFYLCLDPEVNSIIIDKKLHKFNMLKDMLE